MSYLDEDDETAEFRDQPDEIVPGKEAPPMNSANNEWNQPPKTFVKPATRSVQATDYNDYEEESQDEENEDFSEALNDANLRLEQGQLYKLILNHNIFEGVEADEKALSNVQKEIRGFAKQRMEVMLGMRQDIPKDSALLADQFPFNSLEIEALKALALAATQGASAEAEPFIPTKERRPKTLNPIGNKKPKSPITSKKPLAKEVAPVSRNRRAENAKARILAEEGISQEEYDQVFDTKKPLTKEELARLSPEEIVERNRASKVGKRVQSSTAVPMPTAEHMEAVYTARAAQASQNPQMQTIMSLVLNQPKKS